LPLIGVGCRRVVWAMNAKPNVPGWCPNIRAVLDKPWWPGRLIFGVQAAKNPRTGEEFQRVIALCPACGKWVPAFDRMISDHPLPAGSDTKRAEKAEFAREQYGQLRARELLRREIRHAA